MNFVCNLEGNKLMVHARLDEPETPGIDLVFHKTVPSRVMFTAYPQFITTVKINYDIFNL